MFDIAVRDIIDIAGELTLYSETNTTQQEL